MSEMSAFIRREFPVALLETYPPYVLASTAITLRQRISYQTFPHTPMRALDNSTDLPAGGRTVDTITDYLANNAVIQVLDYAPPGTIINNGIGDATSAVAAATTEAMSTGLPLVFASGTYKVSSLPNWASDNFAVIGQGTVIIHYTGTTANAVEVNAIGAGLPSDSAFNVTLANLIIDAPNANYALFLSGAHHSRFINIRILSALTAGIRTDWCVLSYFQNIWVTTERFTVSLPPTGIYVRDDGAGRQTSSCTFINCAVEGVSGSGFLLNHSLDNNFFNCTSEGNQIGFQVNATSFGDTFYGAYGEANSSEDLAIFGQNIGFIKAAMKTTANPSIIEAGATGCYLIGGAYYAVAIDAAAVGTRLLGISASTGLVNSSPSTVIDDCFNTTAGQLVQNLTYANVSDAPTGVNDVDSAPTVFDPRVLLYNTALTANRTVTLPITGAYAGMRFIVIRNAGGAFSLNVGGLVTIPANVNAQVTVIYTGGAWALEQYTTLPNANALATSPITLTNGAGTSAGTLTNAPAAGNPTKWLPVNDNGTVRYVPAW